MKITIELSSDLKKQLGYDKKELTLKEGALLSDIFDTLGLDTDTIGIVTRGQTKLTNDTVLNDGDSLKLYPPIITG